MNWPPPSSSGGAAAKPKPDLRFEPPEFSTQIDYTVQDEGLVAILADRAVIRHSGEIVVECYDGAAIGELIAEAELEDGRVLQAEVKGQAGSKKILIPDREEGVSEIARAWRTRRAAGLEDKEDNEDKPAGDSSPGNGDGLSVWEEYRGFYQGGAWRDNCLPFQKDLFVINKVGALAKDGIELFRDVTALVVHDELLDEEADTLLVVNHQARADRKIVDQHCLRMKEVSGGVGYARRMPGQKFPGPPKNTLSVRVAMTASVNVVYQITPTIRVTRNSNSKHIAHELGHGIGIYHHGDRDHFGGIGWFRATGITIPFLSTPVDRVIEGSLAGRQIDVLLEAGLAPLSNDQIFGVGENGITIWIGERSGQHSGDADCIMRYQVAKAYRREGSPSTRVIHATREAPGDTLCTSPAGTIFNDPTHAPQSRYGPADTKRGNCAHQFVISDKYDKQYR